MSEHKSEGFIYFKDIIYIFVTNIKVFIVTILISMIIALIYIQFFTEPLFISSAKFISSKGNTTQNNQLSGLASQFGMNIGGGGDVKWAYSEVIKSRTLADAVLKREFKTEKLKEKKTLYQILSKVDNLNILENDALKSIIKGKFLSMIGITENKRTNVYTLSYKSNDPILSKEIVTAIIEELDFHQKIYNENKIKKSKIFVEERISDIGTQLINAEENLKVFRERNRRIENSPSLLLEQQRLLRDTSVLTGVITTLKQQYENIKLEEVKDSEYVIMLDYPELPLSRSSPKKRLIMVISFIQGLILSALIVAMKVLIEKISKKDKEETKKMVKILYNNVIDLLKFR